MADMKVELTETQKQEAVALTIDMFKQQSKNDKKLIKDFAAENQRYKEALEEIAKHADWDWNAMRCTVDWCREFTDIAKQALAKEV